MYKINKKKSGFTLIELLVVVAIIVILGTVFFVKMQISVNKSDDVKLKAKMNEALIQSKLYYNTNGYYSNVATLKLIVTTSPENAGYFSTGFYSSLGRLMRDIEDMAGDDITYDSPTTTTNHGPNITYGTGAPYDGDKTGSYALAVPLDTQNIISTSSGIDYYCIDSSLEEGKVIDEVAQMTGSSTSTTPPDYNGVASCG